MKVSQYNTENYPIPVAYICGADMMVKASVIEEVGAFDPDFFLYFEETELCFRINKRGYDLLIYPMLRLFICRVLVKYHQNPNFPFIMIQLKVF